MIEQMTIHKTDRAFPVRLLQLDGFDYVIDEGVFEKDDSRPLKCPEDLQIVGSDAALLNATRTISVVGTRSPFYKAFEIAQMVARLAVSEGILVVSGFATGIDAAAHYGAMDAKGKTVAVLGSGVNVRQPTKPALERFILDNGLFVSELCDPEAPREYKHLMARDRITAGLADVIFVIETDPVGGAVHTAKIAHSLGKPVYAINWSSSPKYRGKSQTGNKLLIDEGVSAGIPLDGSDNDVEASIRSCFPQI